MKTSTFVDTNILIDVWGPAGEMTAWSTNALTTCRFEGPLVVNTLVWAELAPLVADETKLEIASAALRLDREPMPWNAAFLAGVTHARYRRAGGVRERTLPDFLVGAHAFCAGYRLLTRDPNAIAGIFPS